MAEPSETMPEKKLEKRSVSERPLTLRAEWVTTPLGTLLAAGDDHNLYLLAFLERDSLEREAGPIQKQLHATLEMGGANSTRSIAREVESYFAGELREFATPFVLTGTPFQVTVWNELRRIPFGETISYAELARRVGNPSAFRAVAQANSRNPIVPAVPCHRVISNDGGLGGYSSGLHRKRWLLDFEKSFFVKEPGRQAFLFPEYGA